MEDQVGWQEEEQDIREMQVEVEQEAMFEVRHMDTISLWLSKKRANVTYILSASVHIFAIHHYPIS